MWIAKTCQRDDVMLVTIDKSNPGSMKFLNNEWSMVDRLKYLRNELVLQKLKAKEEAEDEEIQPKKLRVDATGSTAVRHDI